MLSKLSFHFLFGSLVIKCSIFQHRIQNLTLCLKFQFSFYNLKKPPRYLVTQLSENWPDYNCPVASWLPFDFNNPFIYKSISTDLILVNIYIGILIITKVLHTFSKVNDIESNRGTPTGDHHLVNKTAPFIKVSISGQAILYQFHSNESE